MWTEKIFHDTLEFREGVVKIALTNLLIFRRKNRQKMGKNKKKELCNLLILIQLHRVRKTRNRHSINY